jgi:glycosyltransferase involved in cell wall biosynthesis
MRICLLSLDYPPASTSGHARQRQTLAVALANRGHQVHVVTRGPAAGTRCDGSVLVHEVPIGPAGRDWLTGPGLGELLSASQALYEGLLKLLAEQFVDIVDIPLHQAQGLVTLRRFGGPSVVWLQHDDAGPARSNGRISTDDDRVQRELDRICLRLAGGVVTDSPSIEEVARREREPDSAGLVSVVQPGLAHFTAAFTADALAESIAAFYERVIASHPAMRVRSPVVYQVVEALDVGDAVSNIARRNSAFMAELGQPAEILARYVHPDICGETQPLDTALSTPDCGQIFHYWNYNISTSLPHAVRGRKAVYYHNITPPEYFSPGSHQAVWSARAYAQIAQIADAFDLVIGVSRFNIAELVRHLSRPKPTLHVYPVVEAAEIESAPVDAELLAALRQPGRVNLVFVGRVVRNKRQDRLMRLFDSYYREINRRAHLWLVGNDRSDPEYRAELERLRGGLRSGDRITFTGKVSDPAVNAYYRAADVFVCASEHEGFCVPIAQAMALDIPVLAFAATAVPETMGESGLLIHEWDTPRVAELMHLALGDQGLRERVIVGQRANLKRFSAAEARARLAAVVSFLRTGEISPLFEWPRGLPSSGLAAAR